MADAKDFLLEIGTEEMPSAPLMHAVKQLGELVAAGLDEAGLDHGEVRSMSTPRRLAVIVRDVAVATKEVHEVKRGPAVEIAFDESGAPTKAAAGFARKFNVDATELVRKVDADGREYVFAEKNVASKPAEPILSALSERVIGSLEWPNYRSQRWGAEHASFVRPVRWICALLGESVVDVTYADVTSSNVTRGHRLLGAGEHVVASPAAYVDVLREAGVLLEDERRERILAGIAEVEAERGGAHVDTPKRIFDEVVNLCEWPTVLVGTFDEEFLDVPSEIICESMLSNQRYFPIYDAEGKLTREFVVVSNSDPRNNERVIDGNERVVRARLDDAKFFYEEDLKQPLESYVEKLKSVVFQEKLGTVYQKSERMVTLAEAAAVSQAVVEFTNQQGVMGGYYATAAGEPAAVATAIREHYRPRFAGDELPSELTGKAVAIADKLDTVCGIFAINEPPTGSSDPYAIRRSAIGIIAMLRTLPSISLKSLISMALESYAQQGIQFDAADIQAQVEAFFAGRLASIARDEGVEPDTIEAVSTVGVIDPEEFLQRAHALEDARKNQPELFDDLATAYARAAHLADASLGMDVDASKLGEAERALLDACADGERNVASALASGDYAGACSALAELREPIDRFFEDVLVMDEDTTVRENRLRLLNRFANVFAGVADIGALSRKK